MSPFNLSELVATAHQLNASDIHLSAGELVRLRVDGEIKPLDATDVSQNDITQLLSSCLTEEQYQRLQSKQEIDFIVDLGVRLRGHAYYTNQGPTIAYRLIPKDIPSLSSLNAPQILFNSAEWTQGLVLVTGPTGSGKTTTVAALIDHMSQHRACHMITLEDPIEYCHRSQKSVIHQREIGCHTNSFEQALRAALRADPDIIFVGELRDLTTIRLALTAAETGHLVLATLHTTSAAQTVNRIIDVFPASERALLQTLLSQSLRAVISQRLIKKQQGGRSAAFEVMVNTSAVSHLIREGKFAQLISAIQTGKEYGMQTLEQGMERLHQREMV